MTIEEHLESYAEYHRNPKNKVTHYIGIPMIIYGLFNMLYMAALPGQPHANLAAVLGIGSIIFYFTLNAKVAVGMIVLTAPFYLLAAFTPHWGYGLAAFLLGWVIQFIGHYYEGKSPAFFTNVLQLLIGPLWIGSHLMIKAGLWTPRTPKPVAAAEG
jgi:uncharacterized membrane protein YGL010W